MFRNRLYYWFKPFLPWSIRVRVRRWIALRKRERMRGVWPILPGSERPPAGWLGWPDGKAFAFILTHDVEGAEGLQKVKALAELEMSLGFRSCFNFIPAGEYQVPSELLRWLATNGFEVGVHDWKHDGHLFCSPQEFARCAPHINGQLQAWGATGFRSGFMLRNLDWLHQLNIQYDCSTFDTDPFEPQPDGVGTIFPFWVKHPDPKLASTSDLRPPASSARPGYLELPYTLPQDSTLFLVLRESTPKIWLQKLDWVAAHRGMALVNVHPDYLQFPGEAPASSMYPVQHYIDLLEHVRRHHPAAWCTLPGKLTDPVFGRNGASDPATPAPGRREAKSTSSRRGDRIWIDLENTPHIPFFKPIIRELEARGYQVVITARDAYQTCQMAERYGLPFTTVGRHYGKHKFWKVWGLFVRAFRLLPFALRHKPRMALNHGSRTQTLVANLLGIPTVTIMDYEHAAELRFLRPLWDITPSVVPHGSIPCRAGGGILSYPGIKEDVYVQEFKPDPAILKQLALDPARLIVTVRPPATEAHYHNSEADRLFENFMNRLSATPGAQAVVLPRNKRQELELRTDWPQWFASGKAIIPSGVVEGLNLVWHSDLVVSGGGTMNREAAALGVPVYSIFRGKIGAVDRQLEAEGRMVLIKNTAEIQTKIPLVLRLKDSAIRFQPRPALDAIVKHIEHILQLQSPH